MQELAAVRVMTWNIHHGEGVDGRVDLERIAAVIRREAVDLVALQEVDRGVRRTQGRDLPAELAALTGMSCVFSNNFHYQGGEYGNAILSRLPVVSSTNRHYRMLREGEQRGLLEVRTRIGGQPLRFFSTHIDYRPDDAERVAHVEELRRAVASEPGVATVMAGDFNALPGSRVHALMEAMLVDAWKARGQGSGGSYPAPKPERRIDYILVSPEIVVERVWVVDEGEASDHRPVVAELTVRALPGFNRSTQSNAKP
jgi:endonuclease/exonuclease/phosphatase family metal-dependent hydrolase